MAKGIQQEAPRVFATEVHMAQGILVWECAIDFSSATSNFTDKLRVWHVDVSTFPKDRAKVVATVADSIAQARSTRTLAKCPQFS